MMHRIVTLRTVSMARRAGCAGAAFSFFACAHLASEPGATGAARDEQRSIVRGSVPGQVTAEALPTELCAEALWIKGGAESRNALESCVSSDPDAPPAAVLRLGALYEKEGRFARAAGVLRRGRTRHPNNLDIATRLAVVEKKAKLLRRVRGRVVSMRYVTKDEAKTLRSFYEPRLDAESETTRQTAIFYLSMLKAGTLMFQGQDVDAEAALQADLATLVRVPKFRGPMYAALARISLRLRRYQAALLQADAALLDLARSRLRADTLVVRSACLLKMELWGDAEKAAREAIEIMPEHALAHGHMALALGLQRRARGANAALSRALSLGMAKKIGLGEYLHRGNGARRMRKNRRFAALLRQGWPQSRSAAIR